MTREIRITVDDDEVFERMKHRKNLLDLSWEDVLRRGLHSCGSHASPPRSGPKWHGKNAKRKQRLKRRMREHWRGWHHRSSPEFDEFEPDFEMQHEDPSYEIEIGHLEDAEDAILEFEFLDDEPSVQVPLRITMETSTDGLTVDVAAVRESKDVSELNRFASAERKRVAQELARGKPALLRIGNDEMYQVNPVLSWNSNGAGFLTVTHVEIPDVVLEGAA